MMRKQGILRDIALITMLVIHIPAQLGSSQQGDRVRWRHLSSTQGEISEPDVSRQVATLTMDIDKDGTNDFVIASYEKIAWFRRSSKGWASGLSLIN